MQASGRVSRDELKSGFPLSSGHTKSAAMGRYGTTEWTERRLSVTCAASKRLVDVMQQKYCQVPNSDSRIPNDSLESEQAGEGLTRVDLSSDATSIDVQEDACKQRRER